MGLWTAQPWTLPTFPGNAHCAALEGGSSTFAPWQSALFGAGAAWVVLLVSMAAVLVRFIAKGL